MEEATYGMTGLAMQKGPNPGDDALLVKFYTMAVRDPEASLKEGRPIFVDKECISIRVPGERRNAITRIARQKDRERFHRHYAAFKSRTDAPEIGTPLAEWPQVTSSEVANLAYNNIKTVEQLAAASEAGGASIAGFYELRDKAQKWLAFAADNKDAIAIAAIQEENEELKARLLALEESMSAAAKPKTSRKKKAEVEVEAEAEAEESAEE